MKMNKLLKCRACNNVVSSSAKFCPYCGAKFKNLKKFWWIFVVVVVLLIVIVRPSSRNEVLTTNSHPYDVLTSLQNNKVVPFHITELAKNTLNDKPELFESPVFDEVISHTDDTITYNHLTKSINNYGEKLIHIPEAFILKIVETDIEKVGKLTEIQVTDNDANHYYLLYLGELSNIFDEDSIEIYALPLATTYFDNISGGTTKAVVLVGSYIQKI
jgi:hypothetical protein